MGELIACAGIHPGFANGQRGLIARFGVGFKRLIADTEQVFTPLGMAVGLFLRFGGAAKVGTDNLGLGVLVDLLNKMGADAPFWEMGHFDIAQIQAGAALGTCPDEPGTQKGVARQLPLAKFSLAIAVLGFELPARGFLELGQNLTEMRIGARIAELELGVALERRDPGPNQGPSLMLSQDLTADQQWAQLGVLEAGLGLLAGAGIPGFLTA